uniref:Uncharacterized protein n=1 Tax=Rhizophora mucronata TaxID=61149 RepID=A0A2P2KWQ8_RHIMU
MSTRESLQWPPCCPLACFVV